LINGFVVIDKPAGITSHDVVSRVRRILGTRKVGHTGTLDPFATGVLPIAVNEGTKAITFLDEGVKCYDAVMQLGVTTDTLDMTGVVLRESEWLTVSQEDVEAQLRQFTGHLCQIPPMYSAIKCGGQPLYKMARNGQVIERESREIDIFALKLLFFTPPFVGFKVVCSRGTYVRTLADDIGSMLGCGAALKELRRLASGPFTIAAAVSLDELEGTVRNGALEDLAVTPYAALAHLPEVPLSETGVNHIRHGRVSGWHDMFLAVPDLQDESLIRLTWNGSLAAIAQYVLCEATVPRIILKRVFI
jgi:tRNA pseudouridine55 synthase